MKHEIVEEIVFVYGTTGTTCNTKFFNNWFHWYNWCSITDIFTENVSLVNLVQLGVTHWIGGIDTTRITYNSHVQSERRITGITSITNNYCDM